ncbi:MAG: cysteine dioxygenase family protein [Burkholderiales bacterium]|nr:cysteine dioxygenase family protein [Burkholderiales bacterium]
MAALAARIADFRQSMQQKIEQGGVNREVLSDVLRHLMQIAADRDAWSADHYPDPQGDVQHVRYLIQESPDKTCALYLNVLRPGKRVPPHDHTTWACIAPVKGTEINRLWERVDDRSVPGRAQLKLRTVLRVEGDTGAALLPDDIHSLEIPGSECTRHLHLYGRALETLSERVEYDVEAGTVRRMDIGVQTRR